MPKEDYTHLVISTDVFTPLVMKVWTHELSSHPDKIFTNYILQGIKNGFHIGFDRRQYICSATGNMHIEKSEVVSEYLLR